MSGTIVRERRRGEAGLKSRHALANAKQEKDEMSREVPLLPETVMEVASRFNACDRKAESKVSYTEVIEKVLKDFGAHEISVRDKERLLEYLDADKDGMVSPIETVAAQYFITATNQGYEAHDAHTRVTFHGDSSPMKICVDQLFAKMQLRSIGFLRACLEHSGKPVVASGQDFMRFPATDAENASTEAGGDQDAQGETINRHAHFLDSSKERLSKPAAQQASPSQKSPLGQHLQSWLEVATSEALNPSKNQREKSDKTSKQSSQVSWTQNPQGSARTPPGSGLASPSGSTRASRRAQPADLSASLGSVDSLPSLSTRRGKQVEALMQVVVASSPRRRLQSPEARPGAETILTKSNQLLSTITSTNKKVSMNELMWSVEPDPVSSPAMMTGTQWTRGDAKKWGGNWGLRDANISIQHDLYRALESPTGISGRGDMTSREKLFLQPLPERRNRGKMAIENEIQKIFKAYARPTDSFGLVAQSAVEVGGKDDILTDMRLAELILGTNLAKKEKFEPLDDNGNGKLSASELRMGMRNMGNVFVGLKRIKVFLGEQADDDLSYEDFIYIVKQRVAGRPLEPYKEKTHEIDADELGMTMGHLGFRRFVSDLLRFEKQGIPVCTLDEVFLLGAGYDTQMEEVLRFVREDNAPEQPLPCTIDFLRFRHALIKYLSKTLMPTPPPEYMGTTADYDAEYTFIRHVMLPNAKRPTHDPGHPLYTNFYQEDVLLLLRQYEPVLQFIFAHYATLERYHNANFAEKMDADNFPRPWGAGNGCLRMLRSEFVAFCENFGLVGSQSGLKGLPYKLSFTKTTANWVFTSAKNGLEASPMCEECKFAQLAACEHMTFREFIEAILRCALILFPLEGMRLPDVDMFPQSCFVAQDGGKQAMHKLLSSFPNTSLPGAIAKRLDPRSASAEPMLETSFLYSSSSLGGSPTRSDGSPMPEEWMHGRLSPISQRMQGRGPPGLRRSLPAALTGPPLLNPITAHTPQIGYRAWRRHFQPGSGVGINHELLPIRPL